MGFLKINDNIIKAVIFDFDGTLAKLNIDFQYMRKEVLRIASSYGIGPNLLKTKFVLEMINTVSDELNLKSAQESENFKKETMNFIEYLEIRAAKDGELFENTKKLLICLKANGLSTAVVSRNCEKAICLVFPDILKYCDAVVCRDKVANVKPHPQHLHTAINVIRASPPCTLMIGDHPLDIETGRNAGTFTAGVLTGHHLENDFLKAGADLVLAEAGDLIRMIK
ncbi:MAG: HAD family hydrolase [Syntrophaceae bacterium]|nr:HAD family hydrolase [Syntrophaceae bacterium]